MSSKPKPAFFVAVLVVIAALAAFAFYRFSGKSDPTTTQDEDIALPAPQLAEDPANAAGLTTVQEYEYVAAEKLPPVKGTSAYDKLEDNTVVFAINVWAGWAPIVYANEGFEPKKVWKAPDGSEFKVKLTLIDDPVQMRDSFAAGAVHIGWATVDMLPLLLEGLWKDSRVRPRVYQQIDWSNGGDGIVARDTVQNVGDLKGKTIVLAQNSPSHYFALNALLNAGVQPRDVKFKFTKDAFQAAKAFVTEEDIAAAVSWAPDIYNISEAPGNKMLVSTETANKLIADVWFSRADFAKDHPAMIEGIVRGVFDAMSELKTEVAKEKVAVWMGKGYGLPTEEAKAMLGDAHWTNYAENKQFFLNQNNPANFQRTYETAQFLYQKIGQIENEIPFDQIMDFSVIQKLSAEEKYASQRDEYQVRFTPTSAGAVQAEQEEILTKTVVIHFSPNSHELNEKIIRDDTEQLYDPNTPAVIEEIGRLAGQYGAARIVVEGHSDASMRSHGVPEHMVIDLSKQRANAVKEAVVNSAELDPNQFATAGLGWARPADPQNPNNHTLNRRVEVKVYPLEAPQ